MDWLAYGIAFCFIAGIVLEIIAGIQAGDL